MRGGGGFEVAVMDVGGGSARVVATADAEDPVWGADSRHLIYSDGTRCTCSTCPPARTPASSAGLGKISEPTVTR